MEWDAIADFVCIDTVLPILHYIILYWYIYSDIETWQFFFKYWELLFWQELVCFPSRPVDQFWGPGKPHFLGGNSYL